MLVQLGLCQTWSETPKTGFLASRLIIVFEDIERPSSSLVKPSVSNIKHIYMHQYFFVMSLPGPFFFKVHSFDYSCSLVLSPVFVRLCSDGLWHKELILTLLWAQKLDLFVCIYLNHAPQVELVDLSNIKE